MRGGWRACADRCARRELARLHLQPTNRTPMFDSLQLGTGAPAAILTIIRGEVAVVFFAASCSVSSLACSLACPLAFRCCCCGSLSDGMELQGGYHIAAAALRSGAYLRATRAARPRASISSGIASPRPAVRASRSGSFHFNQVGAKADIPESFSRALA